MSDAAGWEARVTAARDLHRRGDLHAAARAYAQLLAERPDTAVVLELNAILLGQQGQHESAAALFERALRLAPENARIHLNYGALLLDAARPTDAAAVFRRAATLDPTSSAARRGLARALLAAGDAESAIPLLDADAHEPPSRADAWALLGSAYTGAGRHAEAVTAFRRAAELGAADATAWFNLGLSQFRAGDAAGALPAFQRALELGPEALDALRAKAAALRATGRVSEAADTYRRCSELAPNDAGVWSDLGHVLQELGSLAAARAAYERAVALDPLAVGAWTGLAELHPFARGDALTERLLELGTRTELAPDAQSSLLFAAAQACDALDDVDRAFEFLTRANALRRASFRYDVARDERRVADLPRHCTRELLDRLAAGGSSSARPIFVVGMPRSGSTLVEHVLASHPDVAGAGELPAFQSLLLRRSPHYPYDLDGLGVEAVASLAREYLRALDAAGGDSPRVTDKFLPNFLYVGLIHACLPHARVIWCLRDPVDTCFSCYRKAFAGQQAFAYDLRELGRYYRVHLDALRYWDTLLPGRVHVLHYERLVADPPATVGALLRHCGLEWHDACLRAHENARAVQTASAAQVRRPIHSSSVGNAQRYARHLGPLLEALGQAATVPTGVGDQGRA